MDSLFQKAKGIVEGVVGAVSAALSRVDLGRAAADAAQSYLEGRFRVGLFPASASDGSIEFRTRDGALFATLGPQGIRVETGGAVYFFTVDEAFKARGAGKRRENSCRPEGREVVRGDDGAFEGVHDYDRQQSIPADAALSLYSKEELHDLIGDEVRALQNAARRHAEEAPSAESRRRTSPPAAAATDEAQMPREANQVSRDEPARQGGEDAQVSALPLPTGTLPELRPPAAVSAGQQQPSAAVSSSAGTGGLALPARLNIDGPQVISARVFMGHPDVLRNAHPEPGGENRAGSKRVDGCMPVNEFRTDGTQVPPPVETGIGDVVRNASPVERHFRVKQPEAGKITNVIDDPPDNNRAVVYPGNPSVLRETLPSSAERHASMPAESFAAGDSKFDSPDNRFKMSGTVVFIEGDPLAIAGAQSDKGGLAVVSLLGSSAKGGHYENEMRHRLYYVEAPHTKRDHGGQRDGKGRGGDGSPDEWDTLFENEDAG